MKYTFKYYLHDHGDHSENVEYLVSQDIPEDIAEKIAEQRIFYEIEFECSYDTDTGKVEWIACS